VESMHNRRRSNYIPDDVFRSIKINDKLLFVLSFQPFLLAQILFRIKFQIQDRFV